MRDKFLRKSTIAFLGLLTISALSLQACFSVKLVADYDEQIDRQVTDLYREVSSYMTELERRPQVSGSDSVARTTKYDSINLDINTLKLRVSAKEKNEQQIQQVEALADSWKKVGELQKLNSPTEAYASAQNGIEVILTAILKLELTKKRS